MRINLNPEVWGPKGWFFIESAVLGYPDNPTLEDKNDFKNFFYYISKILPCERCRVNFSQHLKNFQLDDNVLNCRESLFKWLLNIHNITSNKNFDFNSSVKYYIKQYKNNDNTNIYNLIGIIILVLIIILIFVKYYK